MTEAEARAWLADHVSRETLARLAAFVELLREEMGRQNLISPASAAHVWARHVVDSAQLLLLDRSAGEGAWVDIGSGAGFPGLVVAAAGKRPVLLVEPRPLRTAFLQRVVDQLMLDATVVTGKAQDLELPTGAAVISARAVASTAKLLAWASHLSRPNTIWLLPKGKSAASELAEAKRTWQGRFHVKQSATDPEGGIIVAQDVKRRRA